MVSFPSIKNCINKPWESLLLFMHYKDGKGRTKIAFTCTIITFSLYISDSLFTWVVHLNGKKGLSKNNHQILRHHLLVNDSQQKKFPGRNYNKKFPPSLNKRQKYINTEQISMSKDFPKVSTSKPIDLGYLPVNLPIWSCKFPSSHSWKGEKDSRNIP